MIPVCEPLIGDREAELVLDCLRTGWISSAGQYIERFETEWAAYCGMPHGIAVSNGTTALDVAVRLLDLQPGDEVILPTFTIISCAQAIIANGGRPVLVDSDPHTWQMDVTQVAAKITARTKAIMVVHIYGHPADMDPLLQLANQHNLLVIEDAAEVHGAEYKGRKCGGLGDISTFSFYANKLITTGEGGMVLTRRDDLAARASSLRNLCFQPNRRFYHEEMGYNYRLTNLQAALGCAQLERLEQIVAQKRHIAHLYAERLAGVAGLELPLEASWAKSVYWVYGLVLKEETGLTGQMLAQRLAEKGIQTRPFFLGMHEQPVFNQMGLFVNESYPISERLARQGLYLPNGLTIKESDIDYICAALHDCFI
ncbi:MAG: DegT/DnrJ/EryC1/StrS family aminotransferase [Anaerolineae bacterium]|nr:DegT/DnrJ/EryC1/StrS family aminotransferase [Anaerolineae bacterium]